MQQQSERSGAESELASVEARIRDLGDGESAELERLKRERDELKERWGTRSPPNPVAPVSAADRWWADHSREDAQARREETPLRGAKLPLLRSASSEAS